MSEKFELLLEKYADIAVNIGINLQQDQTLIIHAPVTAADFVKHVVSKAYDAGARDVSVEYNDENVNLLKFMKAPMEGLKEFPEWRAKGYVEMAKNNAAFLNIYAPNPTLLKDVDPERIAAAAKASGQAMKEFNEYTTSGKISWSIISVPSREWAVQVFPELSAEESVAKLWEEIFQVTRIDVEDPVQNWSDHIANLNKRAGFLNENRYHKLHYYAENGTNLTIELPKDHVWFCADFTNTKGIPFVPNMPTEEVFTSPLKEGVNGVVKSSKPLNYGGNLIDKFSLTFEKGKVIDFSAEVGEKTLEKLLETDEGATYLGEIALVPYDSPISNSNVLFYNTLFDENASCHLALGACLPMCYKNGTEMTKEELVEKGLNDSITHVDFMIGTSDLNIDGITEDGETVAIFRNGNWAF